MFKQTNKKKAVSEDQVLHVHGYFPLHRLVENVKGNIF